MRVSQYFSLARSQPTLDFVDIDIENDTPVYIDPSAIKNLPDEWSSQSFEMLSTFFDSVLDAIKLNDQVRIRQLLIRLQEPNETHFGLSKGKSRGRGLGPYLVQKICDNLTVSRAAETGILEDLEDTALFIDGIGKDIISDVTTNVIRGMLVAYTQSMATMYGIPLEEGIHSGLAWDPIRREWDDGFTRMPVAGGKPLLLVPKILVRYDLHLTKAEYFRNHLAPALQDEELDKPGSKLIRSAKDGRKYVKKSDIEAVYDGNKEEIARLSFERAELFHSYKEEKQSKPSPPLTHDQLSSATRSPRVDFDSLLRSVVELAPGADEATNYHRSVESLLTALFYPALTQPVIEHELDQDRKRVDITYTNTADRGFFNWLTRQRHPSSYIFVECKNYQSDLGNAELDQICGRFSPLRGKVGLLVCRSFVDKARFIQRCRDAVLHRHEFVLVLDDDDLRHLVDEVKESLATYDSSYFGMISTDKPDVSEFRVLHSRFRELVS